MNVAFEEAAETAGWLLLGTALARPILAYGQVKTALREGADALAHGATGKGNDQVRFEVTYATFAPNLTVIEPWREWTIRSREDALQYAAAHEHFAEQEQLLAARKCPALAAQAHQLALLVLRAYRNETDDPRPRGLGEEP